MPKNLSTMSEEKKINFKNIKCGGDTHNQG